MSTDYILRPLALSDIEEIWDYTKSTWSQKQTESYLGGLLDALDELRAYPALGRPAPEFEGKCRRIRFRSHLIYYTSDGEDVIVLRILHARLHLPDQSLEE